MKKDKAALYGGSWYNNTRHNWVNNSIKYISRYSDDYISFRLILVTRLRKGVRSAGSWDYGVKYCNVKESYWHKINYPISNSGVRLILNVNKHEKSYTRRVLEF